MSFLLFFLIFFLILGLAYVYVAWRLIVRSPFGARRKNPAWILLCLLFCLPMISFILNISRAEGFWPDVFSWIGYVGLGFFSMVFTLLLARDLASLFIAAFRKAAAFFPKNETGVPVDAGRRQF